MDVLSWSQLNFHHKHVFLLSVNDYYAHLDAFLKHGIVPFTVFARSPIHFVRRRNEWADLRVCVEQVHGGEHGGGVCRWTLRLFSVKQIIIATRGNRKTQRTGSGRALLRAVQAVSALAGRIWRWQAVHGVQRLARVADAQKLAVLAATTMHIPPVDDRRVE